MDETVFKIAIDRRRFIGGALILGVLPLAGCQTYDVLAPIEPGVATDVTDSVLPMINALRAGKGLPALFNDPVASNAAKDHAIRMARANKMSHFIGAETNFLERMKRLGVTLPAAENIAVGQDETARAFDAWVRSKHHLDNMTGPFRGVGMAVSMRPDDRSRPFWAMILSNADKPARVRPA